MTLQPEAIELGVRTPILNSASAISRFLNLQENHAGIGNLVCWMTLSMPSFAGIALALYALSIYSDALCMLPRGLRRISK